MASSINTNTIDSTKPAVGAALESTPVRNNFQSIKDNLVIAKNEIEDLQNNVNAINSAMIYKGGWNASSGSFPSGAKNGYVYTVTVAGTVDGISFDVTDRLLAIADNPSTSTYANNWLKEDYTDKVSSVNGQVGTVVLPIGRNRLINGNFDINQRGVSGTVTLTAGSYGHDRWKAGASGCTYTFSSSNGITTLTITAGSLQQVIESVNVPLGTNTCVLSWTGTAQGKIGAGGYGASGVTASVSGGSNLTIEFNTGTLSLVQFEKGSVPTEFEQRLYQAELDLCMRYYETGLSSVRAYSPVASSYASTPITFKTVKRAVPTITNLTNTATNCGYSTLTANSVLGGRHEIQSAAIGDFYSVLQLWKAEAEL